MINEPGEQTQLILQEDSRQITNLLEEPVIIKDIALPEEQPTNFSFNEGSTFSNCHIGPKHETRIVVTKVEQSSPYLQIFDEEYREKIDEMHRFMTEQLLPTKYKSDTAKRRSVMISSLARILFIKDESDLCLYKKDYQTAFQTCRTLHDFDQNLLYVKWLVKYYKASLLAVQFEKATELIESISTLIKSHFHTTPKEIMKIAKSLQENEEYLDSILFYQIACIWHKDLSDESETVVQITNCVEEIFSSLHGIPYLQLVFIHFVDIITSYLHLIKRYKSVPEVVAVTQQGRLLQYIGSIQMIYLKDFVVCKRTFEEGIKLLEDTCKTEAVKYPVYGELMRGLSIFFLVTSRYNQANVTTEKLIELYQKEDVGIPSMIPSLKSATQDFITQASDYVSKQKLSRRRRFFKKCFKCFV